MFKKNKSKSEGRLMRQWFNLRLTVGHRLSLTFAAIFLSFVVLAVAGYVYVGLIESKFNKVADDTLEEIQIINDIYLSSERFLGETREYLLFGETSTLEEINESAEETTLALEKLQVTGEKIEAADESDMEASLIAEINSAWEVMQASSAALISLYDRGAEEDEIEQAGQVLEDAEELMSAGVEKLKGFIDEETVKVVDDARNGIRQVRLILIFVPIGTALLSIALGYLLQRSIVTPILDLNKTARDVEAGNLAQEVKAARNDEIGELANSFNLMLARLRETIHSLDRRAFDLATVAEVSTAASTVLETDKLLQQVVDLAKERFGLYHAHIYLLNETGDTLVLASGAGKPGRQMVAKGHSIPLDREQSLVARAARERKGVTVNDVTQAPDFLPNPLLPETRSELAVPMMVGEQVIGVFDVQSETVGRFADSDIAVQTTLASQVASAVQNARSFTLVEQQRLQNDLILGSAGEGIFGLDEKGNHTFVNPAAAEMLGYTSEELVGKHSHSTWHHTHADGTPFPSEECPIYFTINKGIRNEGEEYFIRKDGTGFHVRFSSKPILQDDRVVGAVVTFADITQQKQDREVIAQRARQQEALNLITQKIQGADTVESALQVAARELGRALGQKQTLVMLKPEAVYSNPQARVNPQALSNESETVGTGVS